MINSESKKPIRRIGFDLDGVVLYNPIRMFRPLVAMAKKNVLHKENIKFFVPQKSLAKLLWNLVHKSSLFVSPGFYDTMKLLKDKNVEAYLITARFGTLQEDFDKWMKKIDAKSHFKAFYHNPKDEQPHLFKQRMIDELNLDMFIDDNWDIVNHLNNQFKDKDKKILWITNLLDSRIKYKYKFSSFKKLYHYLKSSLD